MTAAAVDVDSLSIRPRSRRGPPHWSVLVLPAAAILVLFGIALIDLLQWSVRPPKAAADAYTLANYIKAFTDPLYFNTLIATFKLSGIATAAALALGIPMAFWIVRTESATVRAALIILVAIPFMTSLIVRLYALTLMLSNTGLVNRLLQASGIIDDGAFIPLIRNQTAVIIGLTYFVLPFVIFTLAGSFRRFDRTLEEAAANLGADEVSTFFRVTVPLLMPGIVGSASLAFVLAGTAFATPLVLGGSAVRMIANMIYDQASVQNMPMAATLSAIALVFTFVFLFLGNRWGGSRG